MATPELHEVSEGERKKEIRVYKFCSYRRRRKG